MKRLKIFLVLMISAIFVMAAAAPACADIGLDLQGNYAESGDTYVGADVWLQFNFLGTHAIGFKANMDTENPYYAIDPWDTGNWVYLKNGKAFYTQLGYQLDTEVFHFGMGLETSEDKKIGMNLALTADLLNQPSSEDDIDLVAALEAGAFCRIGKIFLSIDGKYQEWVISSEVEGILWRGQIKAGYQLTKNLLVSGAYQVIGTEGDSISPFYVVGFGLKF